MVNSDGENLSHDSEQSKGIPGSPDPHKQEHQNKRIRFFEIMTFFLGIVIAALCHGLYTIFSEDKNPATIDSSFWLKVIYAISFLIFLLKCFIDDVMDDYDDDNKIKNISRAPVVWFALAWVFMLFAALSVKQISISSGLLAVGLFCLICFIHHIVKDNPKIDKKTYCCYAKENAALIIILLCVALFTCECSSCPLSKIDFNIRETLSIISVVLFFFFCPSLFICPLFKSEKKCGIWRFLKKISCISHDSHSS